MKVKYSSIAIFAGGLILGALANYELPRLHPSDTEKLWREQYGEDGSHRRTMAYQDELNKLKNQSVPGDTDALNRKLETQLKIEELIIKSREGEYAKLTPFTSTAGALVIALLGFAAGLFGKKRD